jgi:hypothetical protein
MVLCSLSLNSSTIKSNTLVSRCLNQNKILKFKDEQVLFPLETIWSFDYVDALWHAFKDFAVGLLNEVAPLKKIRVRFKKIPWCDTELRVSLRVRDKLYTEFLKKGTFRSSKYWVDYCKANLFAANK